MSTPIKGLVVTFKAGTREEHAEAVRKAIELMGGVISATYSKEDHADQMNQQRIRHELSGKLWEVLK